ncbi:MAG: glycine--tRNA ligase subunit beta [Burkholderiaceae bacterium]|nr:MAG: glycine--tRNA ligase subunit beta [Burkholderiaceae bacterium]
MTTQNLLVELFVEELPPKALKKLGEAFAEGLRSGLQQRYFLEPDSTATTYASPRRLAVYVTKVHDVAPTRPVEHKVMSVSAALETDGTPKVALRKRLEKWGRGHLADLWPDAVDGPDRLYRGSDGKSEAIFFQSLAGGELLQGALQSALEDALEALPIPKLMQYQLADGWTSVQFVRPAHGLVALHGDVLKPVEALGLAAGRETHGHRFEARIDPIVLRDADSYAQQLKDEGAVIASFEARRAEVVRQLTSAAAKVGGGVKAIDDDALLDEVTALVERPNVLVCVFESEFLEVPQECLILTMKANQKYFPLLDAQGGLTNRFLVVSNIAPEDASLIIAGNERVVRPRLADAKFFFDQDRKKTLASRVEALAKVVYHNKLGTQGERVQRVRAIARAIAAKLGDATLVAQADQAAQLAKADLVTDMVGEFPELQGTMGRYYALHDGLSADVADAIEDHYKPRFAGDTLPRGEVGVVVALADKLETLVGMFGIGNLPTGDRDPFALRRHALGVVRMLVEKNLDLGLTQLVGIASSAFAESAQGRAIQAGNKAEIDFGWHLDAPGADALSTFIYERSAGTLREQGYNAQEVEAVLSLRPQRLGEVPRRLEAVRAFATLPEAAALAAANKRIANILKKAPDVDPHVSELLLKAPAEAALFAAMNQIVPRANTQFEAGNYTASLQTLAALRVPVDAFFESVMVNADEMELRLNRLGLLKRLHDAMNRVADLSRLVSAP